MLGRSDRQVTVAQAIICALMIAGAVAGRFPSPVPLLYVAGALGSANAIFELMRTFGAALLGGVAAASVALATVPFVTCSTNRFDTVFACTGDSPTWHLTGTVIAAGLAGAGLVLTRFAARAATDQRLSEIQAHLAELHEQLLRRDDADQR